MTQQTRIPLLGALLATDFPDVLSTRITATDDTNTGRRYRMQLVSQLARGLTITVIAETAGHPVPTRWAFVAVDATSQPAYAERVITASRIHTAEIRIRIARSTSRIVRTGRGDFTTAQPSPPPIGTHDTLLLDRLRTSEAQLTYLLGVGVHAAAQSQALSWLSH